MPQRSLALTALALAVAIVVSNASVVLGDETWDDVPYHTEVAPPRLAAAAAIARAELPAWWDGAGFGVPLLAEPAHGALAPTLWPAHTPRALDALLVLHLWFAALGVAAWARRRGASELAGLGAGLLLATSGVFASAALRGALPALALVPWLGVAADALADAGERAGRARGALGVGAALGAIALAGQLAVLADAVALVLVIAGGRARPAWLAAALGAGLALGALQWVPAALQLPGETGARVTGLPLARLVQLVVPGRFGAGGGAFPSVFIGAGLCALARPRGRDALALALFAGAALVAGRGGWPAWAGAPELHLGALAVVIAACAARGLDGALAGDGHAARALLVGAGLTACAAIAAAVAHPDAAAGRDGAVAAAGLALAGLVSWRPRGSWAAPIVLALVVAPTVTALPDVAPTTDRAPVEAPAAWASAARAATPADLDGRSPVRVYRPDPFEITAHVTELSVPDAIGTLAGASAARWGVALADVADPARDPIVDRAWLAAANAGGSLLERFGVGVGVFPSSKVTPPFHALGERGSYTLVELPVTPVAAVMHGWRWVVAPADAFALLFPPVNAPPFPRGTVVLRGAGESRDDARPPTPCVIEGWREADIALTCNNAGAAAAYAVVTSAPAPGWSARVDDAPVDWLVADVLRRAVPLPPGSHRVSWRYSAPGLPLGAGLAALGLLALVGLGALARRGVS